MRVLHVYKDYAPVIGGIENHIRLLSNGLRECGVDVRVLVTNTGSDTVQAVVDDVPVYKAGRLLNVSTAPIAPDMFRALPHLETQTDIAHLHAPYPPGELGQLLLGRSRRTVLSYHSDIVRQKVMGALYSPFLRLILRRADLISVASPAYIRSSPFLAQIADKCRVIPYGIDLQRFRETPHVAERAAELRKMYVLNDQPLILFVGRLRHYKGVDVLLSAMQKLDAHLLIVGTGSLKSEWQTQTEQAELSNKVTFAGDLSDEQLVHAYHAADVFVLPSTNRAEAFGIVQVEAMASGLPLISTELGTGTSYVNMDGETGFVVPPGDVDALAAAIARVLGDDALRYRMGQAARHRAKNEFSVQMMVARMINLYQEVLDH